MKFSNQRGIIPILITFVSLFLFFPSQLHSKAPQSSKKKFAIREVLNIAYNENPISDPDQNMLDLYLPVGSGRSPLLFWIHGGAWSQGGRKQEAELARRFAERGIGVAVTSYRLSRCDGENPGLSQIHHPVHIEDCVQALKWVVQNGPEFNVNIHSIVIGGYSAGAHLAALMVTDERYLTQAGLDASVIAAALPIAGVIDLVEYFQVHKMHDKEGTSGHVICVFKDEETVREASPSEYILNSTTPMLVISDTSTYVYLKPSEVWLAQQKRDHIEFIHDRKRNHHTLYETLQASDDSDIRDNILRYICRFGR